MADLGITKTQIRPHVPDDNPYSESHFRTLKYLASRNGSARCRMRCGSHRHSSPGTTRGAGIRDWVCCLRRWFIMDRPRPPSGGVAKCWMRHTLRTRNGSAGDRRSRCRRPRQYGSINRSSHRWTRNRAADPASYLGRLRFGVRAETESVKAARSAPKGYGLEGRVFGGYAGNGGAHGCFRLCPPATRRAGEGYGRGNTLPYQGWVNFLLTGRNLLNGCSERILTKLCFQVSQNC